LSTKIDVIYFGHQTQKILVLRNEDFFIQAAGLAYHHRAKCGVYHQPFGLYFITRQRVFFPAELMI
jgi:hypothetical protein